MLTCSKGPPRWIRLVLPEGRLQSGDVEGPCCGLNVCVPPTLHVGILTPKCDVLSRWT